MYFIKQIKNCLIVFIKFYKYFISPFLPISCRFYPTCSTYSIEAIKKYNIIKAIFLIFKRILKCNSLFKGGYDPS